MKNIQGANIDEKMESIDSLLETIKQKQMLQHETLSKNKNSQIPIQINGYLPSGMDGQVMAAYMALGEVELSDGYFFAEKLPKDVDASIKITIKSLDGGEKTEKIPLKQNAIPIHQSISLKRGDGLVMTLSTTSGPLSVWGVLKGYHQ